MATKKRSSSRSSTKKSSSAEDANSTATTVQEKPEEEGGQVQQKEAMDEEFMTDDEGQVSDQELEEAFHEALEHGMGEDVPGKIEGNGKSEDIDEFNLTVKDIPGVGPSIAKKLMDSGFTSVRAIATISPRILQSESGIGEKTAEKITQAAQELCNIDFMTAEEVFERRKNLGRIVTGSNALNELLGGGVESGALTELFGEYRTGKTQIAHQLCVNVQLPRDQGGLDGKALYVDTEGTFRPERLVQMAMARGMDVSEVLKNVIYARAYNSEHQVMILRQARKLIEEQNVKLIVVDSIIGHMRAEYAGMGSLAPRQQLLNQHLHQILQLAETYSIAALVTNQVQAKPDIFFGNPIIAAGGNILAHASTYRIYLRKGKNDTRVAKMVDAPSLPEGEAAFKITEAGIEDID